MKLFCHGDDVPDRPCCSLDSVNDARRVCEQLGVPHYVLNLESAFGHDVVDDFVDEYARGRTPIPCVRCNTFTKFRDLVRKADAIDARWIATGHYARVHRRRAAPRPRSGQGPVVLPLGDRPRRAGAHAPPGRRADEGGDARHRARSSGCELVAEKRESQDICFVPDGDHARVIARRLGADDAGARARTVRAARRHASSASTTDSRASPSASGADCRADSAEPMFVVAIEPRRARWSSARATSCSAAASSRAR